MKSEEFLDVSRETLERLEKYTELLIRWNQRINLVAKSTIADVWSRHILDSAQIFDIPKRTIHHWADLGSGGGFPGMVVAILASENDNPFLVSLVESDIRKAVFLKTVVRELGLAAHVLTARIEDLEPLNADVISARALADLPQLFEYSEKHLAEGGCVVFPKGKNWRSEVERAQRKWNFDYQIDKSKTSEGSVILCASGVSRV